MSFVWTHIPLKFRTLSICMLSVFGDLLAMAMTVLFDGISSLIGTWHYFQSHCTLALSEQVLEERPHVLHNRTIDPKKANPRGGREPIRKIFVGGLDPDVPEDEIRNHFGKYGKVS